MRGEEEGEMTNRIEVAQGPVPLEAYAKHFDPVLSKSNQREGFRRYLAVVCGRGNSPHEGVFIACFPEVQDPGRGASQQMSLEHPLPCQQVPI